jgi:hypothetical protein
MSKYFLAVPISLNLSFPVDSPVPMVLYGHEPPGGCAI